ncbi:MAG: orotate phosphoribosyltransferase, partial [Rhodospirillales bacterium]|nr:orotate phosphoribosyltransferase [Rhodospirillales bacterium]
MPTVQKSFASRTSRLLLDIKAVNFRPEDPYKFTSGWASPVYIDCRKVISFLDARRQIMEMAAECIGEAVGWDTFDAVAGGETAGIPYAAWMSETASLPMLYVRKKAKGFGRDAQIEGDMAEGSRVLLVEDLATDGASKLNFVNALRGAGAQVSEAFVVFFYRIFKGAEDDLAKEGLKLHYLATWADVLAEAEAGKDFSPEAIQGVREFLADPVSWS